MHHPRSLVWSAFFRCVINALVSLYNLSTTYAPALLVNLLVS